MPILADVADSRVAIEILDELQIVINEGFHTLQLQKSPHLSLVSKNFYDSKMKKVLAKWLLLWMRARKVPTDKSRSRFVLPDATTMIIHRFHPLRTRR